MKIFLVRHGQTTGDTEGRYGGDYDDHLSEKGRLQAAALAQKLSNEGIEIIYCSPKIRAQETASILQKAIGCQIETAEDLKERNQNGVLTGMLRTEAKEKYPELVELLKDYHNCLPDTESYETLKERVLKAWNNLITSDYETITIVTHGGPIKVILRDFLKKEIEDIRIEDCARVIFKKNGNKLEIIKKEGITTGDK